MSAFAAASVVWMVFSRLEYLRRQTLFGVKLEDQLRNKVEQLLSERSEIERFLLGGGGGGINNNNLNKKVIQLAYDIENAIECHAAAVAAAAASDLSKKKNSKIWYCCSKGRTSTSTPLPLNDHDLLIITKKIDELKNIKAEAAADELHDRSSSSSSSIFPRWEGRHRLREKKHEEFVLLVGNIGEDGKLILLDWPGVAITGEAGVGKTTQAHKAYVNPIIQDYFRYRAWVCVTHDDDDHDQKVKGSISARGILESILDSFGHHKKELIMKMETMELIETLYTFMRENRCLIVLDDVCSTDVWESIQFAFPKAPSFSRIIITTRSLDVAHHFKGRIHQMSPTGTVSKFRKNWHFFKRFTRLQDEDFLDDPEIKDRLADALSQYNGFPLAIRVVANYFRGKRIGNIDWDNVLHNLDQRPSGIFAIGYDELPLHLKPCFLYLGLFPPDQLISVEKLYLMWRAEGLIIKDHVSTGTTISSSSSHSEKLMVTAKKYLSNLADRYLILNVDFGAMNSCQLHNLIRDLCMSQGKEDGFFEIIDFENASPLTTTSHRVAIYLNDHYVYDGENLISSYIPEAKLIRSLLFFGNKNKFESAHWPLELAHDLKDFEWTRVLDFDGVDFRVNKLILKSIDKLIYLRYLGFRGCYLEELMLSCSNFLYLETLDLRVNTYCKMTIPNVLWKLSNLLHLYFPTEFRSGDPQNNKLRLAGLTRLETLENFHAGICETDGLEQLEHLQIFTGTADGNTMDFKNIIDIIINARKKKHLSHSSLILKKFDCYSKERQTLLVKVLSCNAIQYLHLEGHLKSELKRGRIAQRFTEMVFHGSEFREDPMPILGTLPNLRTLILCNDAFVGNKIDCPESSFKKLRNLTLTSLPDLRYWVLAKSSMPHLSVLTIEQCDKLNDLPGELMEISLDELKIVSMPEDFENYVRHKTWKMSMKLSIY
ncbi:hypothetical protein ACJIZ3_013695 [Penstemon smallii]|uniref:NB-ARC domain-containing protein n=1 Tax=Penstemon smallii TaxID=265156 RepID=A0ABD3RHB2_9LAMI